MVHIGKPFLMIMGTRRFDNSIEGIEEVEEVGLPEVFPEPSLRRFDWYTTRVVDISLLL